MTLISLIRHGEPIASALGTHYGQLDIGLSPRGESQSDAVAQALADIRFDAVWSSDLVRARLLADRLAATRGLVVQVSPALRERTVGAFQGLSYAAAAAAFPEAAARLRSDDGTHRPPEGESIGDLAGRVIPAIEALVADYPDDHHLAVATHGGPIRVILGQVLGLPLANLARIKVDYCSLSTVEFREGRPPRVVRVNLPS